MSNGEASSDPWGKSIIIQSYKWARYNYSKFVSGNSAVKVRVICSGMTLEQKHLKKIELLEADVKLLRDENESLTERAEDIYLLGIISEKISAESNREKIIDIALEEVCLLKDIHYSAFICREDSQVKIVDEYSPLLGISNKSRLFPADEWLYAELEQGAIFFECSPGTTLPPFVPEGNGEDHRPNSYCLIPASVSDCMGGMFLFVNYVEDASFLQGLEPMLRRIADVTVNKLELISLIDSVNRLNRNLEQKVRERAGDLQKANAELITQIVEREKLEEELRQIQKMEAMGTLAGGIAHDFNNILSAIMGYLELAKTEIDPKSPANIELDEVFKASLRAKDLVQQILTFSRRKDAEKKPVKLNLLVQEGIKLLRASIPATIEIRRNIPEQCPNVVADPTQIHQIVMNLCTNAYQAMRNSGGVLSISLEEKAIGREDYLLGYSLEPGPYLLLQISDTGQGISPEILPKIFEPYFTTKKINEGTGLGLSVVHGIVKSHHGHITVYSEVGVGTTFKVYLPIDSPHEESKPREGAEEVLGGSERIIFVDDEESLVKLGSILLRNLGYEVAAFGRSTEALQAFREAPDNYDLIITDMTMPGMTGVELAREVKQVRADIPIILCTGFTENLDEKRVSDMGIFAYLTKPVLQKNLADTIRKALGQGERKI